VNKQHFRKLERMYAAAPCNRYYRPKIAVSEGAAEIRIPVRKKFFHAAGAVHGSVYFKILDDAAFFACNSMVRDFLVLTASFSVTLVRPVTAGTMRGEGKVLNATRNLMMAESRLLDAGGREVARGVGMFVRSRLRLSPAIGYR
jgi:uncharacterized protein (TIGR00369 family)